MHMAGITRCIYYWHPSRWRDWMDSQMIDKKLKRGLILFLPVSIGIMLVLSSFAPVMDSRPVSNGVALTILIAIGIITIALVFRYMLSRTPLTLRQERAYARTIMKAARSRYGSQEHIRFRDKMLDEDE